MRRVIAVFGLVIMLLALTATTALGHHVISIDCDGDDIEVIANVFDDHRIKVVIDGETAMDEAIPGTDQNHSFTFPYTGGPAFVEVTLFTEEDEEEDSAEATVTCFTPNAPELTFSDCEGPGEQDGSITVTGLSADVFVQINGPTVLTIEADGTYPLAPGHYGFRSVFKGGPLSSGTFDIEECPEIGAFSIEVCPITGEPVASTDFFAGLPAFDVPPGASAIRFRGGLLLIMLLTVRVDGHVVTLADTAGDGTIGDVLVPPGVHAWSISNAADTVVLASGEVNCPECNPTEVPPSLPNTASTILPSGGGLGVLVFVVALTAALGALAVANVRFRLRRW